MGECRCGLGCRGVVNRDERALEGLVLEGIKSGRSRTDIKTFLKRMHARVDELEAEKGRGGKTARSSSRR